MSDDLGDLINTPPEFKEKLVDKIEMTVNDDSQQEYYTLPEITDIEENAPYKVTVIGLQSYMKFDDKQNKITFYKNIIKIPGTYKSVLKI